MTKTIRQAVKDQLTNRSSKLVDCVRVERLDGEVFRWTNHNKNLEMSNGTVYVPDQGGADGTAITSVSGLEGQKIDMSGPLLNAGVSRDDLLAGRFDFADVYLFRTIWDDPVEDDLRYARGWWGTTTVKDHRYEIAFKSLAGLLQNQIGDTIKPTCRHQLGDSICRVDLANGSNSGGDFTVTGTLSDVVDAVTIRDSNRSEPDDHFGAGFVEITSGDNKGLQREVDTFTQSTGEFVLWDAFPFPLSAGDSYKAVVGCRKRRDEDCKNKFSNVVNFGGAPDLPGEDVTSEIGTR